MNYFKRSAHPYVLSLAVALPACSSYGVKPGDMSAKDHESAAAEQQAEARRSANQYDRKAVRYATLYPERPPGCDPTLPGNCSPLWTMTKNPTDRDLAEASAHAALAKRHRAAAQTLRDAEARACSGVVLADRDMSPFHRRGDIQRVEEFGPSDGKTPPGSAAGAAVLFATVPGLTAKSLQQIVDCHLARNAALGFDQSAMGDCPLNVRGATAKVRKVGDGLVVEVTSSDAAAALEIVRRTRLLVPGAEPVTLESRPSD